MTLQSNGYFRKWKITFDGYFAFGGITSLGDLEKTNTAAKATKTHTAVSFATNGDKRLPVKLHVFLPVLDVNASEILRQSGSEAAAVEGKNARVVHLLVHLKILDADGAAHVG